MAEEKLEVRLQKIEHRLDRIEIRLRKKVEERKIDLKEKFRLHDRAQGLLRQFEEIYPIMRDDWFLPSDTKLIDQLSRQFTKKDLKEIVKSLVELVDVCLGVKFP